jgi:hypothetical protein
VDEPVADVGCRRTGREAEDGDAEDGDAEDQTGGDGDALADVPGSRAAQRTAQAATRMTTVTTLSWIQAVIPDVP